MVQSWCKLTLSFSPAPSSPSLWLFKVHLQVYLECIPRLLIIVKTQRVQDEDFSGLGRDVTSLNLFPHSLPLSAYSVSLLLCLDTFSASFYSREFSGNASWPKRFHYLFHLFFFRIYIFWVNFVIDYLYQAHGLLYRTANNTQASWISLQ